MTNIIILGNVLLMNFTREYLISSNDYVTFEYMTFYFYSN